MIAVMDTSLLIADASGAAATPTAPTTPASLLPSAPESGRQPLYRRLADHYQSAIQAGTLVEIGRAHV